MFLFKPEHLTVIEDDKAVSIDTHYFNEDPRLDGIDKDHQVAVAAHEILEAEEAAIMHEVHRKTLVLRYC